MKAVVAFNQEKALVGAFSVLTNLRMELFQALVNICSPPDPGPARPGMDTTLVILFALKIEIGDCDVCKLQLSI